MLVVKKSGVVEGDVFGDDVVIEGEVVGNVSVKIKSPSKFSFCIWKCLL